MVYCYSRTILEINFIIIICKLKIISESFLYINKLNIIKNKLHNIIDDIFYLQNQ